MGNNQDNNWGDEYGDNRVRWCLQTAFQEQKPVSFV